MFISDSTVTYMRAKHSPQRQVGVLGYGVLGRGAELRQIWVLEALLSSPPLV